MKRKARQIMSLLLALAMIFSVFAGTGITAFAQEQAYLTLSTEQTEYGIGEYFYMTLSGFNIENVETADIQITFDSDCIDCCYIEANPSAGFTFGNGGFVSIDTLTWSFAYDEQTEKKQRPYRHRIQSNQERNNVHLGAGSQLVGKRIRTRGHNL